jgi:hypothetical protein
MRWLAEVARTKLQLRAGDVRDRPKAALDGNVNPLRSGRSARSTADIEIPRCLRRAPSLFSKMCEAFPIGFYLRIHSASRHFLWDQIPGGAVRESKYQRPFEYPIALCGTNCESILRRNGNRLPGIHLVLVLRQTRFITSCDATWHSVVLGCRGHRVDHPFMVEGAETIAEQCIPTCSTCQEPATRGRLFRVDYCQNSRQLRLESTFGVAIRAPSATDTGVPK